MTDNDDNGDHDEDDNDETIVMTMKMIVVVVFEMTDVLLSIVDPGFEHLGHVIQTFLISKDTRH